MEVTLNINLSTDRFVIEHVHKADPSIVEALASLGVKLDRVLRFVGKPTATIEFGRIVEQDAPTVPIPQPAQMKGRNKMKATQKTGPLTLGDLKDRLGQPATLNGDVTWTSSDETVVAIEDGADGKYAVAKSIGAVTITANGDASSDDGIQPFQATGGLQVTSGDVTEGTVNFGTAIEQ